MHFCSEFLFRYLLKPSYSQKPYCYCGCSILSSFFFSFFFTDLRLLLLSGNKHDRLENFSTTVTIRGWLLRSKITVGFSISARHHCEVVGLLSDWGNAKHCSEADCTLPLRVAQTSLDQLTPGNGEITVSLT